MKNAILALAGSVIFGGCSAPATVYGDIGGQVHLIYQILKPGMDVDTNPLLTTCEVNKIGYTSATHKPDGKSVNNEPLYVSNARLPQSHLGITATFFKLEKVTYVFLPKNNGNS